jgi:mitochondrial fission protein ELM1
VSAARLWVLSAGKPGDDAQARLLADAIGWPYALKRVGVDRLQPPWPAVVVSSGRMTEQAARALRTRAGAGLRVVQVGRPHGPLADLDLVVGLPQYELPEHSRVVRLALPLQRVSPAVVADAARAWTPPPGACLDRPRIAVLVGGTAWPYMLDAAAARRLAEQTSAAARAAGGSLLVTTSRRTPPVVAATLAAALTAAAVLHCWSAGDPANPYLAFLGLADRIIVTADSASMLADAVSTKPVEIFPLPEQPRGYRWLRDRARGMVWRASGAPALGRMLMPLVERLGVRPRRDLARLHAAVYARGLAVRFGAPPAPPRTGAAADGLAWVAARVRTLGEPAFEERPDSAGLAEAVTSSGTAIRFPARPPAHAGGCTRSACRCPDHARP